MTQQVSEPSTAAPVILIMDDEVVERSAVANYLRQCGYQVIEAAHPNDARTMMVAKKYAIDIVIVATDADRSAERFGFSRWIRENYPKVRVLIAATVEKTVKLAADICEEGPHLRKPYEHQSLLDWIKRLRT